MQTTFVLTTVLLVLGSSPARAQSNPVQIINNAVEELRNQLNDLQTRLTDAVSDIYNAAERFTNSAIDSMNNTFQELQENINELREQYSDTIYDKCFPARPIATFFNHSIDGVTKCVNSGIQRTLNNAEDIHTEINTLYAIVTEVPIEMRTCGWNLGCLLALAGRVTELPVSVGKIAVAVADIVTFLSTLHDTFVPCAAMQARYDQWAMDSISNITSCITSVDA